MDGPLSIPSLPPVGPPSGVDRVCIDQENVVERNHQVQLIGALYSRATMVLVWLGLSTDVEVDVKEALREHERCLRNRQLPCWSNPLEAFKCRNGTCSICRVWRNHCNNPCTLLHASYWIRVWIIQELMLAQDLNIFVGSYQLDLDDVRNYLLLFLHFNLHYFRRGGQATTWIFANQLSALLASAKPSNVMHDHDWHEILIKVNTTDSQCTDKRDMIYGLLGLIRPSEQIKIVYELPTEEVFACLLEKMMYSDRRLCTEGELEILYNRLQFLNFRLSLPSRWHKWIAYDCSPEERYDDELQVFFACLDYLHIWGLVKTRRTVVQLAQIVVATTFRAQTRPTASSWQRIDHPDYQCHYRDATSAFKKSEESIKSGGVLTLVEQLNTATPTELEQLLYRFTGWRDPESPDPTSLDPTSLDPTGSHSGSLDTTSSGPISLEITSSVLMSLAPVDRLERRLQEIFKRRS